MVPLTEDNLDSLDAVFAQPQRRCLLFLREALVSEYLGDLPVEPFLQGREVFVEGLSSGFHLAVERTLHLADGGAKMRGGVVQPMFVLHSFLTFGKL